jgi:tetraacyldisaccharide 4'-kinase
MPSVNTAPDYRLEALFTREWQRRGWIAVCLLPLSLLYAVLIGLRRLLYALHIFRQVKLPVPVIVVGNIFVGGTGKTPFTIWLVESLRERGFRPGVISRGYGRDTDQIVEVKPASTADEVGDEPLLIASRSGVPVVVGRDRVWAARRLLGLHPEVDVVIADDGLQHYALGRQIEIQLSDARGVGNGWLLPAGPLREPRWRRADFYVLNGIDAQGERKYTMHLQGAHIERLADRQERVPLAALHDGRRVAAAAGIGHPQRFFDMLVARGVPLSATLALSDHHDFTGNPLAGIEADVILITEKDAVKCARNAKLNADRRLWVVPVRASIAGPLADNIVEKLRGYPTA